jgi:hypothetical protein
VGGPDHRHGVARLHGSAQSDEVLIYVFLEHAEDVSQHVS